MKDHEVREFVDRLTQTAREHAGCDSLRAAISREVKQTLVNDSIRNSKKTQQVKKVLQEAECTCSALGPCIQHL